MAIRPTEIGPLVVWNDDEIAPGTGFGLHGKPKTVPRIVLVSAL